MGIFVSILGLIVAGLLMLVILVQNSKGGGLSSTFASSNQVLGVRKTTDFLEKATWYLAIALLALCLLSGAASHAGGGGTMEHSQILEMINSAPVETQLPTQGMDNSAAPPVSNPFDNQKKENTPAGQPK